MSEQVTMLFRPVGQAEFELVRTSGFSKFPPRLPQQPIFYPVLSEQYATQIARDWNTKDESSGFVGYVLRFMVRTDFLNGFQTHTLGSSEHQEYWVLPKTWRNSTRILSGLLRLSPSFGWRIELWDSPLLAKTARNGTLLCLCVLVCAG
jgi:hypothetical protein